MREEEALEYARDKISQGCPEETVRHLLSAHFGLADEDALKVIDAYYEIMETGTAVSRKGKI